MAKFSPQHGKPSQSGLNLGEASVKQLNEAVETGDYPKIAMALGRDQSQLSEEIRAAMRATHQAFLTAVGDFVTEALRSLLYGTKRR